MGAKTPEQTNKNRPMVKCDVCGRKFVNVQALKSHHKFLHMKPEASRRVAFKKQAEARPIKKKVVPLHMLKRVIPSPDPKKVKTPELKEKGPDLAPKPALVSKKPEFECPVCAEKFPVYFTAFRHIQKNHCVDENGEKVPPNSPLLIKPIRIELCASCNKLIRSTEPHNCPKQQVNKEHYMCMGCEQIFSGLVLYQLHIKGLHADGAQNYFFPNRDEFTAWKAELKEQSNIDFIRLNKLRTKEIYHCSHQSSMATIPTTLCPSTITVREYSKGVHVCYYKEHHGHFVKDITLKKYNEYCISLYTRDSEELSLDFDDDNELYQQFKKMVTCIIFDAAKVDDVTLKDLLGKALEMTSILKRCNKGAEKDAMLVSKCLTDTQISKTLDSLKPEGKRKLSLDKVTDTQIAKTLDSLKPEGKRKLSLDKETKENTKKDIKKVKISVPTVEKTPENGVTLTLRPARRCSTINRSVSFNKTTVNKTVSKKNEETPQKSLPKKTEETPQKSSIKKKEEPPKKNLPKPAEVVEEKKQEELVSPSPVPRSLLQSPSSFNDSYKNFVDQNFKCQTESSTPKPTLKTYIKKKEVVKTKIGQFKVKTSVSPKNVSPKNVSPKESPKVVKTVKETKEVPFLPKNFKVKPDIKYEVKEQENDVNILILKI